MANRKYGGKEFSDPNDFKLNKSFDPWGTVGDRGSDETGPTRGAGAYASDDAAFRKPSQSQTMSRTSRTVDDISGDVFRDQGPGPYGEGGSAVRQVGGDTGRRRYSQTSDKKARARQTDGGL
jgi:hypothetical protein